MIEPKSFRIIYFFSHLQYIISEKYFSNYAYLFLQLLDYTDDFPKNDFLEHYFDAVEGYFFLLFKVTLLYFRCRMREVE